MGPWEVPEPGTREKKELTPEQKARRKENYDRWRRNNPERFKHLQQRYKDTLAARGLDRAGRPKKDRT